MNAAKWQFGTEHFYANESIKEIYDMGQCPNIRVIPKKKEARDSLSEVDCYIFWNLDDAFVHFLPHTMMRTVNAILSLSYMQVVHVLGRPGLDTSVKIDETHCCHFYGCILV